MPPYLSPGVYVEEVPAGASPIAGVGTSTAGFIAIITQGTIPIPAERMIKKESSTEGGAALDVAYLKFQSINLPPSEEVNLFTNWGAFTSKFGDFLGDKTANGLQEIKQSSFDAASLNAWRPLAHAVYGFFLNGGTRCYVIRIDKAASLPAALNKFAGIDEIAIVAVPGNTTKAAQEAVLDHCDRLKDRFAVLDGQQRPGSFIKAEIQGTTKDSNFGAIYFPWIKVTDPTRQMMEPNSDGSLIMPPSGHIAGVYARVDADRGVFKAPGNEGIRGALDVEYQLTKSDQDGLNPGGVNIIRSFNSNVKIWGARTMGGDANGEFKYISTRRLFNFLRESIDEGTQFAVFEPNSPALWQRIKRNVGDFLLGQWRDGALLGETPEKAFFVKCDEETNPRTVREQGQVITQVGVAIVKPAEFVIFRIQQRTGG
ncbi:phage tail sheath family protein [Anabaena azotica]|uniref:Phage tail sheath family protein n=1 Tax=Anabaena azotica FACHB-119 TaxID=947527 RepID=A0ABR8DCE4_9NOST|nr:phage tail sheath subtilisin-like domain-containing protein [Anabaena azotica]MBD2503811.1 phage tail sheath family protein [Anabaena azotica FACHB-119]